MNKDNIIKLISKKSHLKRKKCETALDVVTGLISEKLRNKKNVIIDNFGSFSVKRKETEVILAGNYIKTVLPPEDYVSFEFWENDAYNDQYTECPSKKEIVTALSVQFLISKEEADNIFEIIFSTLINCFKNNRSIDLPKFGEFKTVKNNSGKLKNSVRFMPAKKLAKNINHCFSGLRSENLKYNELYSGYSDNIPEYKMSDDFIESYKEMCRENEMKITEDNEGTSETVIRKKLISDELVELHKEIINSVPSDRKENKTNLWG